MVKITGTKTPSWNSLSPSECSRGRGIGLLLPFSSNIQWIMSFISMHYNVWTRSGGLRTVSTGGWRESHQALWSTHRHTSSWQPPAFSPRLPERLTPRHQIQVTSINGITWEIGPSIGVHQFWNGIARNAGDPLLNSLRLLYKVWRSPNLRP